MNLQSTFGRNEKKKISEENVQLVIYLRLISDDIQFKALLNDTIIVFPATCMTSDFKIECSSPSVKIKRLRDASPLKSFFAH